jgi:hypothetical protein
MSDNVVDDYAWKSAAEPCTLSYIVTTPYHFHLKNLALSLLNEWDNHHSERRRRRAHIVLEQGYVN